MSIGTTDNDLNRLAPTQRPNERVVMRQRWRHLLFLHWPLSEEVLRPYIPPPLSLDTYQGCAYIGLIAFTMQGVRPSWALAIPGLSSFHETNVRTYVHLQGKDPGVWFFSLDASNPLAVLIARALWKLPYFWAVMKVQCTPSGEIEYVSRRIGRSHAFSKLRAHPLDTPSPAQPGTLEHFLLERYVLYTVQNRKVYRGRIHHTPYPMQTAKLVESQESLIASAGLSRPLEEPLVHYAAKVDVEIFPLQHIEVIPPRANFTRPPV
ncbi:YqjF family protein [Chthonomonas calidirosea]|uniref:YqjF family protein n=1 Tax=Chthonomonas calidirosea TaxID=454171 RepID=UPI0006EC8CB8|nr:DUF2071 domain-containing protein [Chthonomonas calidirosea]CEK15382.1 hypothetical protein CP488_01149 [Chthonomonas calidirosea]